MDAIAARQIASGSNNGAAATNDPVVGKAANRTAPKVFIQSIDHPHQTPSAEVGPKPFGVLSLARLEAESVCVHIRGIDPRMNDKGLQRKSATTAVTSALPC